MSENRIKIGYFADGPWSHKAFELLIKDPLIEIAFIVPRSDTRDETLLNFSKQYEIPYYKGYRINDPEFIELVSVHRCDLFVSMSFNQIFRSQLINTPPMGTINCHAGKLPFYRGRNILNWALINDEKEFGITVHFIDEGIDTGDIILQRVYPITESDDYSTLLTTAFDSCAEILFDAVVSLRKNSYTRIRQTEIHPVGFYCGVRGLGDEIINWNQTSRQLFNFIRAVCDPAPRATTSLDGKRVTINRSYLIEGAPGYLGTTGQIVGKTDRGYIVKTLDSMLEIAAVESEQKLRIGDKLGL